MQLCLLKHANPMGGIHRPVKRLSVLRAVGLLADRDDTRSMVDNASSRQEVVQRR